MIALQVIGLAIALNAGIFAVGIIWSKHQMKRVAAERAEERRTFYKLEPLPPPGDEVLVPVEDEYDGRTSELTDVLWPHLGWTDAVTLLRIEDEVLGWRRHPFGPSEPLASDRRPHDLVAGGARSSAGETHQRRRASRLTPSGLLASGSNFEP